MVSKGLSCEKVWGNSIFAFCTAIRSIYRKSLLNTERNNTYLAEASISPHFTTTCDFVKYTIIITFWRGTSAKSLPSGNKGSSPNIRCFLKTHYNHKLKINTTAKRSYHQRQSSFFWQTGLGMDGLGYWGNFPVWIEVCYGFNWLIDLFIF